MRQRTLKVERLGRLEYGGALEIQKQTECAVLTGAQADTLLLLEHPHTLTLGRRAAQNGIITCDQDHDYYDEQAAGQTDLGDAVALQVEGEAFDCPRAEVPASDDAIGSDTAESFGHGGLLLGE